MQSSLNPYSTGIWSATCLKVTRNLCTCLNPYSTGIWSATPKPEKDEQKEVVLILILLEYGLQHLKSQTIDFQTLKT